MRGLFLTLMVALLAAGSSGVSGLMFQEPCSLNEEGRDARAECPPTCVQCACCAQPVVAVKAASDSAWGPKLLHIPLIPTRPAAVSPGDVFHVPKPALL